jgi:hypothetical protein
MGTSKLERTKNKWQTESRKSSILYLLRVEFAWRTCGGTSPPAYIFSLRLHSSQRLNRSYYSAKSMQRSIQQERVYRHVIFTRKFFLAWDQNVLAFVPQLFGLYNICNTQVLKFLSSAVTQPFSDRVFWSSELQRVEVHGWEKVHRFITLVSMHRHHSS